MAHGHGRSRGILTCVAIIAALGAAGPAPAQEKPRPGGELIFVVAAEPPGFDGHREETFGMLHPVGPQYNTLIIPHLSKVRGYTVTPSHFLNCQLDTVWLSE